MRKVLLNPKWVGAFCAWILLVSIAPGNAFASPSASMSLAPQLASRAETINQVLSNFDRPEVRLHLLTMGINQSEIRSRLERLNDTQLAQVAQRADDIRAAGDTGTVVVIVLVVVLVLLIWLYATNQSIEVKNRR